MSVDAELLELLACPSEDHAPLEVDGAELVCTVCRSRFPVRDDIPVLLADEATPGPNGLGVPADGSPADPGEADPGQGAPGQGAPGQGA